MHTGARYEYYLIKPYWDRYANMSTQNVYVFWDTPLFYESISWLLKHPDIRVVGETSNDEIVFADIAMKRPNTILIEDTGIDRNEMARECLNSIPWAIKIILLSFNNNQLNIYHHEQRTMVQSEDLLQLVLSEFK